MFNAQASQDIFVDKILNQTDGYFVDIGAGTGGLPSHTPGFYSNTYFFERHRNWNGIAIDYDDKWFDAVKDHRTCKCLCVDLMNENINDVLEQNDCPDNIDYLSIDIDEAQFTVFNELNWDKYKFKILTLEHNLFLVENSAYPYTYDEYSQYREKLTGLGYKILWGNVILDNYGPVEDWWVSEDVFETYGYLQEENINCKKVNEI